ncbi:hypothetical protein MBLNU13_g04979t2 [Cladosporium sp. NU13]
MIGERMLDKPVQKAVVREFMRLSKIKSADDKCHFPAPSCVRHIYNGTSTGSPMRRLMVDLCITHGLAKWPYQGQHPEFLGDLAERLREMIMAQKLVRDFRGRTLIAEDYFV